MIFALATDEKSLLVFPTSEAAIAYCEGVDVGTGGWLFWGEDGLPLQPDFLAPNRHGRLSVVSGIYRLIPSQSGSQLTDMLGDIRSMETNPFFESFAALQTHLADTNRGAQRSAQ